MKKAKVTWQQCPAAENLVLRFIHELQEKNPGIVVFGDKLSTHTSTKLIDWLDHIVVVDNDATKSSLIDAGFIQKGRVDAEGEVYSHPGALLPKIVLAKDPCLAIRVDYLADFLRANKVSPPLEGTPLGHYRQALICKESGVSFYAIERRGTTHFTPSSHPQGYQKQFLQSLELWQSIPRWHRDEDMVFERLQEVAETICDSMGQHLAAHIILQSERAYWQSRNYAGHLQKMRQDTLGLGWANHDHYAFRSSRRNVAKLVFLFKKLGFIERERFYAGQQAGWGAQVMENEVAGLTLFVDVDLTPEEVGFDFVSQKLHERDELGTLGLWCALHGDSILQAGPHHLAARYAFDGLHEDMKNRGVDFLEPFSNFNYLKQAFSRGDTWAVDKGRVKILLDQGYITQKQAVKFKEKGAVGSHLENIERREGFKGFSQEQVSNIIKRLDPRNALD